MLSPDAARIPLCPASLPPLLVVAALSVVCEHVFAQAADVTQAAPVAAHPDAAFALALGALAIALLAAGWALLGRRRADLQLREARTHLQSLGDLLDVWQWQTDAEHRLVALRPPAGAPSGDWLALPAAMPLWERYHAADSAALRACMASGAALDDVEVWDGPASGALHGRLRGRSLTDAAGCFAGYIGTLRDIETQAGDVEPAACGAAKAARAAAAPAAAGLDADHEAFSYTVSHDLRAPIRVVEGFTKIVKEDYARVLDRVGHDHLDRVLGAAARMTSMIDALLALSKLSSQPLARQPVDLSQLAAFIAEDLRCHAPEHAVTLNITPNMLVRGDPTLLRIVLENLLGNAWKYTAKRGAARISFERMASATDTFTIRDNGAGFDMRFADRLFGAFQRLHSTSEFPGHGVGLASVRRIVRRHGGEIWAEAEVDHGARFHFSLPQRDGTA